MATFKEAFASARKAGKGTFMWNGKSYHTKTKDEVAGSGPKARPKAPAKGEASAPPKADAARPVARPRRSTAGTPTAGYDVRNMKEPDADRKARYESRAKRQAAKRAPAAAKNKLMTAANQAGARRQLMEKGFAKGGMAKKGC